MSCFGNRLLTGGSSWSYLGDCYRITDKTVGPGVKAGSPKDQKIRPHQMLGFLETDCI
jgi:hypothetical protein